MFQETRSVIIHCPVDEVFAYATDPRNNAIWNGWVVETVMADAGAIAVGTEFVTVASFLGRRIEARAVITELIPDQRSSIRTTSGPVVATGSRIVEAVDGGTRFTQVLEADVRGAFHGIAESLIVRAGARQMEADLQTLKDLLESGVASHPGQIEVTASATP